ncbi:MAG: (d)CMP kinase [Firmicutes bacterium]|nr:(d)CMP kinase [Bacillota bacterium]
MYIVCDKLVEMNVIQIAIDGPAASGKGTVARMLARRLGFICLDTGALYRGMTIHFMNHNVNIMDTTEIAAAVESLNMNVRCENGETHIYLDDENVTDRLHDLDVCEYVYQVAQILIVRERIRIIQRDIGCCQSIVCEGRDIGSVIFPNAQFKFFLTASLRARARRRYKMELEKGNNSATYRDVENMIRARDHQDRTRPISPLKKAKGARVVSASERTAKQVVDVMYDIITNSNKRGEACCSVIS